MTPWRRPAVAMVGQGPELSHLRRQADVLGVGDLIDFRDDVTHQSWVCALLKSADLFVLPPSERVSGSLCSKRWPADSP